MNLETLESRRLMSVTLDPTTHVLKVIGTDWQDAISVAMAKTEVRVNVDGHVTYTNAADVKTIQIFGLNEQDTITVDPNVKIDCTIDSGLGGANGDTIQGGSGNDTIYLRSYFATAHGGAGNDRIYNYGETDNSLYGDAGNDALFSRTIAAAPDLATGNLFNGGPGVDTVDYSNWKTPLVLKNGECLVINPANQQPFPNAIDMVEQMENFNGGQLNDIIHGNGANNVIHGNGGNDVIYGWDGNDTLYGDAGDDTLHGGTGNDFLSAGTGKNTLYGEDNDDTFVSVNAVLDRLYGGNGTDKAHADSIDLLNSVEGTF